MIKIYDEKLEKQLLSKKQNQSLSKKFAAIGEFVNAGFVKGLEKTESESETATRDI